MLPNLHMIISENTVLLNSSTFMVLQEAEISTCRKWLTYFKTNCLFTVSYSWLFSPIIAASLVASLDFPMDTLFTGSSLFPCFCLWGNQAIVLRDSVKNLGGSKPDLSRRISDNRNGCILIPTAGDLCQVFFKTIFQSPLKLFSVQVGLFASFYIF